MTGMAYESCTSCGYEQPVETIGVREHRQRERLQIELDGNAQSTGFVPNYFKADKRSKRNWATIRCGKFDPHRESGDSFAA
jgi:hypothetical protein